MGVMHPELVMRNMIPVVMAGVLGIYGLIVAVILNGKMSATAYGLFDGYAHLAAGLSCGLLVLEQVWPLELLVTAERGQ